MDTQKMFHFLGTLVILLGIGLLIAWPTMWLWNTFLVPALTIVRPVENAFQMMGINALCYVLFQSKVHLLKKIND